MVRKEQKGRWSPGVKMFCRITESFAHWDVTGGNQHFRGKTNHKHALSATKIKRTVSLCFLCSPIIKSITLCCWRSQSCCQSCCWRPQRWRWRWPLRQTGALRTCSSQTVQLLGSTPHQQLPWRQEQERGGTLSRYNCTVSRGNWISVAFIFHYCPTL